MTNKEAIELAKKIGRNNMVAQGYSNIKSFANHILNKRLERSAHKTAVRNEVHNKIAMMYQLRVDTSAQLRSKIRKFANIKKHDNLPIVVVWHGISTPKLRKCGNSFRKVWTRNGYTIYYPSTRRIEVSAAVVNSLIGGIENLNLC